MAFGAESGVVVVETNGTPTPLLDVSQPAGRFGAATESKFSVKVVTGTPTIKTRVKLVAPKLLVTLNVSVIELPQAVRARSGSTKGRRRAFPPG